MDINCIVALQIPANGFKLLHCFIREICGWRNSACSNYSDLIRIREVTWMKLRGTCTKGNVLLCGHAGRCVTASTFITANSDNDFSILNNDFLCSLYKLTLACSSAFSVSVGNPTPSHSSCLLKRQAERIHFNLINNLVDHITQFSSSASFVWSATTRLTFGVASLMTKHNRQNLDVKRETKKGHVYEIFNIPP